MADYFREVPSLFRVGIETKYDDVKGRVALFCANREKTLDKIVIAPGQGPIEPMYFFTGDDKGYLLSDLEEEIFHSDKTEVIVLN